jgi:hypothetical protein
MIYDMFPGFINLLQGFPYALSLFFVYYLSWTGKIRVYYQEADSYFFVHRKDMLKGLKKYGLWTSALLIFIKAILIGICSYFLLELASPGKLPLREWILFYFFGSHRESLNIGIRRMLYQEPGFARQREFASVVGKTTLEMSQFIYSTVNKYKENKLLNKSTLRFLEHHFPETCYFIKKLSYYSPDLQEAASKCTLKRPSYLQKHPGIDNKGTNKMPLIKKRAIRFFFYETHHDKN